MTELSLFHETIGMALRQYADVSVQETALIFPAALDYESWENVGVVLQGQFAYAHRILPWYLGDWMLHGEAKWGEMYVQAVNITGLVEGTLANYKSVAKAFAPERRRAEVSWAHHQSLQKLNADQQDEWLDRSEREDLRRDELRALLREAGLITARVNTNHETAKIPQETWERLREALRNLHEYTDTGDVDAIERGMAILEEIIGGA